MMPHQPPPSPTPHKDVAPFLKSLRQMLETEPRDILRWTPDGRAFEIHDMERMMASVLPKYFKHCKYTSFQRQLNYFNFRKWTKSKAVVCTFSNDYFVRDQPELAWRITRKKSSHAGPSSTGAGGFHHQHLHHHPYAPRRPHHALARPHAKRHETLAASPTTSLRTSPPAHLSSVFAPPPFWKRSPVPIPGGALGIPQAGGHDPDYRQARRFYSGGNVSAAPASFSPLTISAGPIPIQHAGGPAGPEPTEPLDWMIDCLLPPPDRVDDGVYGCYLYGPGAPAVSVAAAAGGADPTAAAKFEYVVM